MKRLLWLSVFNAVIDIRCLNQRIEQLNMSCFLLSINLTRKSFLCISRVQLFDFFNACATEIDASSHADA